MKQCVKQELLYGIKSKWYYAMTILLICMYCVIIYMNYDAVQTSYDEYLRYIDFYKESNLDIEESLNVKDYSVNKQGEIETVTNPLLYNKESTSRYLYTLSPGYLLSQLLESSMLFFPLVFGVFGLIAGAKDYRHKTIKFKLIRIKRSQYLIANHLAMHIAGLGMIVISLFISFLIGYGAYRKSIHGIPLSQFTYEQTVWKATFTVRFLLALVIALIYLEVGYALGTLFKNVAAGLVLIAVYMFLVPVTGKFDLKNSLYYLTNKVYDLYGMVSVHKAQHTSLFISIVVMGSIVFVALVLEWIVVQKRSGYNC